jgi:hypothetical protein
MDWLLSQMTACRPAFDQLHPGVEYAALQHAQYSVRTLPQRYPGIFNEEIDDDELERQLMLLSETIGTLQVQELSTLQVQELSRVLSTQEVALVIERDRVVDSTVDQIGCAPHEGAVDAANISIRFQGQGGIDAGGLTDDWLSMFMLEAMDPYRQPPLFLLPRQIDGLKEACCLRLNHSLHAFGVAADRERAIMRTLGFVLAVCLKRGRFACNKYTLSKSLLQRLLGQDLPAGLLGLKEEFPDEYQVGLLRTVISSPVVDCVLVARGLMQAPGVSCTWRKEIYSLQPDFRLVRPSELPPRLHHAHRKANRPLATKSGRRAAVCISST